MPWDPVLIGISFVVAFIAFIALDSAQSKSPIDVNQPSGACLAGLR